MPVLKLLSIRKKPNHLQIQQLLNINKHYFGIWKQTDDPAKKRLLIRKALAVQIQLQNWNVILKKKAPWNTEATWRLLQGRQKRIQARLNNKKGIRTLT